MINCDLRMNCDGEEYKPEPVAVHCGSALAVQFFFAARLLTMLKSGFFMVQSHHFNYCSSLIVSFFLYAIFHVDCDRIFVAINLRSRRHTIYLVSVLFGAMRVAL